MGQTVVEKIAQNHMTSGPTDRPVRTGDFLTLRPRHLLTHDNTAAVMKKFETIGAPRVGDPSQPVFFLDHDIQNTSESNLAKYRSIESFAGEQGIDFHPAGEGIGHQQMLEKLYAVPGALVVGSDSHSNMYGAVGALGTPVVRTDAAAIWACGEFWWQIPPTVQVVLEGELPEGASGKDIILALCGRYNHGEVLNHAVEFTGPGIAGLTMDARMSISNMTTEWGALTGWFPVDEVTLEFLRMRMDVLREAGIRPTPGQDYDAWKNDPAAPDPDAVYAARVRLDLSTVTPYVSGPHTVQVMTPLAEMEAKRVAIHKAYLLSCVNSRLEDLEAAARVLEGRRIAEGVDLYVAAASREVQAGAENKGYWKTLLDAGATPLPPSCGPCIGLGTGLLEPGEVGISATNRNFKGRMGSADSECYLASPRVVAASAAAGFICGPAPSEARELSATFEVLDSPAPPGEKVEILDGFPEKVSGRLVFLPQDNLNTDGIYGKDYTYREDVTPGLMAQVVMENYDPQFAGRTRKTDIIVGGMNFGAGSSREQAVTALQAKGIAMVIAGSFSQTYLRNAFNNGFPCVVCAELSDRLKQEFTRETESGERTVIPEDSIDVDFSSGTIVYRGSEYRFPPLGPVPQALVVAGGIENQIRARLASE